MECDKGDRIFSWGKTTGGLWALLLVARVKLVGGLLVAVWVWALLRRMGSAGLSALAVVITKWHWLAVWIC
jgi:hypothetical protein